MAEEKSRYYQLIITGYGGELCIGTVDREFVEFWQERGAESLAGHLDAIEDPEDSRHFTDSPYIISGENPWSFEIDDVLHITAPTVECSVFVSEIKLHHNAELINGDVDWAPGFEGCEAELWSNVGGEDEVHLNNIVIGQEMYTSDISDAESKPVDL